MATVHEVHINRTALDGVQLPAYLLAAFAECSEETQSHALKMLGYMADCSLDDEERDQARTTLFELLMPYDHEGDGQYGMDLHKAEEVVRSPEAAHSPDAAMCAEAATVLDVMDTEEATFASRLEAIMAQQGLTQTELAGRIGVGQSAIAMMLKRTCRPQKATVTRLANALGVSEADLWPPALHS